MKKALSSLALAALASVAAPAAQAAIIPMYAVLNGASESPANASPGTGLAGFVLDTVLHTLKIQFTYSGLLAPTTSAHIHCCTASPNTGTSGVATPAPAFAGFVLGNTSGSFDATFDLTLASSYLPSFVTNNGGTAAGAEAALVAGLTSNRTYLNIHTAAPLGVPSGEIRGFITVPEPISLGLVGIALAAAALSLRRRPSA